MKELIAALELRRKYNKMDLDDVAAEFSEFSDQYIPRSVVEDFRFTGLSNCDFLTSDFLNQHGINNLLQINI